MQPETFFILANIAYIIGTGLLAKKVLENRDCIKDYDFTGSLLTTIGLFFSLIAQIELGYWLVTLTMIPVFLFWALVSFFSYKSRRTFYAS